MISMSTGELGEPLWNGETDNVQRRNSETNRDC